VHGRYLFCRIEDPPTFRRWLGARAGDVTTALPWEKGKEPRSTLNVALTFAGLRELGLPGEVLDSFPEEFCKGMEARFRELGDVGDSRPAQWDERLRGLHGVITMVAQTRSALDRRHQEIEADRQHAGLKITCPQEAEAPADEREPFGFADGISQPAIRGGKRGRTPRPGDVAVRAGEFVVGYKDEGGVIAPAPARIGASGSYMVVRKLEQDVDGFWEFLREEARHDAERMKWLAAKVVGRWPDGTPLVRSPHVAGAPPAGDDSNRDGLNDFTYARDPDGFSCPIGAHIRRTNPRDSFDSGWRFTNRHRIIRRGMPYAARGPRGKPGLIFVCFQASIERQFEFVQSQWIGDGNAFGLGSDPDFLVGPDSGKMTIQGKPPRFVPMRRFVRTRGGDYFFVPGIAALRQIAELG
jgi:Dyp-type peroxidase family